MNPIDTIKRKKRLEVLSMLSDLTGEDLEDLKKEYLPEPKPSSTKQYLVTILQEIIDNNNVYFGKGFESTILRHAQLNEHNMIVLSTEPQDDF